MKVFCSDHHLLHFPSAELAGGKFVRPFECPERVDIILARLRERAFTDIRVPAELDMGPIARLHDEGYLAFLASAWQEWQEAGFEGELIPTTFPARRMRSVKPDNIGGKAGYYAFAAETTITGGTWSAAQSSCASAQSAQRAVAAGESAAFALCRPPGHHAAADLYGGYCFLNNAAVAAQMFLDDGARRVAVLDVDFHHGNGTQDIFYGRQDVFFASLHGQPQDAFPYFAGFADETGVGEGIGANANFPLRPGCDFAAWSDALARALRRIHTFGAEALVVSLGVDTFKDDPISFFCLESADFLKVGQQIAGLGLPTVFLMEGGYAVEAIGLNTVNVLEGFLGA